MNCIVHYQAHKSESLSNESQLWQLEGLACTAPVSLYCIVLSLDLRTKIRFGNKN